MNRTWPLLVEPQALAIHLEGLALCDARLATAIARAGIVTLRESPPGFAGLARVICGQQLSVASARAIWGRVEALGATTPEAYLGFSEDRLRATGLSHSKYRTIGGAAQAIVSGALDLKRIDAMESAAAIAEMTALKGIGPWTAEIYLLFCAGHFDIFPCGDLALQKAVQHALDLEARPDARALAEIVAGWSPHRGAAALMFWRYFSAIRTMPRADPAEQGAWDAL